MEPNHDPRRRTVRHPLEQDQDLSLQASQCDPAADGNCAHHHHHGPNRGHRGGHLQDPPRHHRCPSHRPDRRLYPGELHRPVHQHLGQATCGPPAEHHLLAVGTCLVSILFGGVFAFLVTRTNLAWRKYLSSIFIFPYIMPQWTLAVVWQNLFNSNAVTGTSNGLLAATAGIQMPLWWCKGLFPSLVVLGLHYAPLPTS